MAGFHRPHILHVIDSLALGGAERVLVEIANATDSNRYRVGVCVTRSDLTLASALDPQVTVFSLDRHRRFELDKVRHLEKFCRQEQVDLLHVHMRSSFLFISTMKLMGFLRGIPVIFLEQDGDIEINHRFPLALRLAVWFFQPFFVGVHPELTNAAIRAGLTPERAFIISNTIRFSDYRLPEKISIEKLIGRSTQSPVGVMVANIRPTKNHYFLFDALAELRAEPWTMLLVGGATIPEYLEACLRRVAELGLSEKVIFLGAFAQVPQLLRSVDFGVLTSKSESGPLALLEYVASGLPFASTRVGLVGNTLHAMGIPTLVEPGDRNAFVDGLRALLRLEPEERAARVDRAMHLASFRFDIHSVMTEWYALYAKILGTRI